MSGFEALVREAVKVAKGKGFVRSGERVVVTAGVPLGVGGATNMLRIVVADAAYSAGAAVKAGP